MADWVRIRYSRQPHRELSNFEQAVNEIRRIDVGQHPPEPESDDDQPREYRDIVIAESQGSHPDAIVGKGQVRVWSMNNDHVYDLPVGHPDIDEPTMFVLGQANDFVCVVRDFNSRCIEPGRTERVRDARDTSDAPRAVRVPAEAARRARRARRAPQAQLRDSN